MERFYDTLSFRIYKIHKGKIVVLWGWFIKIISHFQNFFFFNYHPWDNFAIMVNTRTSLMKWTVKVKIMIDLYWTCVITDH